MKMLTRLFSTVTKEVQYSLTDGLALISLHRPASRNAFGTQMLSEFSQLLQQIQFDPSVRVVILQSTVDKVFSAGADLKERAKMTPTEAAQTVFRLRSTFSQMEALPMPTIAAIEGAALGGGLELALACDFRIAGANAIFGAPETSLAILPGAGGTQRLPRLIGMAKAKELIFTSRRIDAKTALDMGVVEYQVNAGAALEKATELGMEMVPNGPIGIRMAKEAISKGMQVDMETGMAIERACYAQVIPTADRMEGLMAFREKRKPVYKGE